MRVVSASLQAFFRGWIHPDNPYRAPRHPVLYRIWQAFMTVTHRPTEEDLAQIRAFLPPKLWDLFLQMSPAEQAHGLRVWRALQAWGVQDRDVLMAGLLHDVGKSRFRLRLWERTLVVLLVKGFPHRWKEWARANGPRWRRALAATLEHPHRGAEMLAQHGAPPRVVMLTRYHHDPPEVLPEDLRPAMTLLKKADRQA